jgi:predicted small lipoprotein YifL
MKKVLLAAVTALAALSLAACVGKSPVLIGKGKGVPPAPPPVVTKG